jgi:hypothetical protein
MDVISYQPREAETIKSVTLADLQFGRPSPYDRIAGLAKMALMLWGALTFGAAAGTAAYYFAGASGEPLLITERKIETPPQAKPATVAVAEIPPPANADVASNVEEEIEPAPIVEARMPRPRPDEPVFTGSVERPRQARSRHIDPCEALDAIGARFIFGMRCQREARVYAPAPPPPPRYYYQPAPYQPPYVVR